MTILALEFSTDRRSVALARDGVVLAEAVQQTESRATDALGLIAQVLSTAKVAREQIEVVAVGLGPGSYTGIRAAIAVAQGWQLARGVQLLGVSSVEAIVAEARAQKIFGRVNVAVDAQRGEFYLASWEISEEGRLAEVSPLKIASAAEVASLTDAGAPVVGPQAATAVFPTAAGVAALASGRTNYLKGEELQPIYLRETGFMKLPEARRVDV